MGSRHAHSLFPSASSAGLLATLTSSLILQLTAPPTFDIVFDDDTSQPYQPLLRPISPSPLVEGSTPPPSPPQPRAMPLLLIRSRSPPSNPESTDEEADNLIDLFAEDWSVQPCPLSPTPRRPSPPVPLPQHHRLISPKLLCSSSFTSRLELRDASPLLLPDSPPSSPSSSSPSPLLSSPASSPSIRHPPSSPLLLLDFPSSPFPPSSPAPYPHTVAPTAGLARQPLTFSPDFDLIDLHLDGGGGGDLLLMMD